MNYYNRHIGDYAKDTPHLSLVEHGAYTLLLDWYYASEKPIPADKVYRIARAITPDEQGAVDTVLNEFFHLLDDVWHNKRADEEIEKAYKKIGAAQTNGKKGGRPPKNAEKKPSENPDHNPEQNPTETQDITQTKPSTKAHQAPITNNQTKEVKPTASNTSEDENATPAISAAAVLAKAMRAKGIEAQSADPRIMALADQGVTKETVMAACDEAKKSRPDERIGSTYVIRIVERWAADAARVNARGAKQPKGGNHEKRSRTLASLTGNVHRGDDGRTIDGEASVIG